MKWKIIYNDGTDISSASSKNMEWNDAPRNNVQYIIVYRCGTRKLINGQDFYNINEVGTIRKIGKLISDDEWQRTRNFMIYGDY